MTMPRSEPSITEERVRAFGHKLAAWAADLPEDERNILLAALGHTLGDDVQGYDPESQRVLGTISAMLYAMVSTRDTRAP
jgi:hypothetical protein